MLFIGRRIRLVFCFFVELFVYDTRSKMLRIQNSHFLFVYEDHEEALIQKEALVDGESLAYIESVELDVWRCTNIPEVGPHS